MRGTVTGNLINEDVLILLIPKKTILITIKRNTIKLIGMHRFPVQESFVTVSRRVPRVDVASVGGEI